MEAAAAQLIHECKAAQDSTNKPGDLDEVQEMVGAQLVQEYQLALIPSGIEEDQHQPLYPSTRTRYIRKRPVGLAFYAATYSFVRFYRSTSYKRRCYEEHALIHCPTHRAECQAMLSKMGPAQHPNAMNESKTKWMFRLLASAEDAETIGEFPPNVHSDHPMQCTSQTAPGALPR